MMFEPSQQARCVAGGVLRNDSGREQHLWGRFDDLGSLFRRQMRDIVRMTLGNTLTSDKRSQKRFVGAREIGPGRLVLPVFQSKDQTRAGFEMQETIL